MTRIAFFTAGTMGAGHLVHGLAIRRALLRAGFAGTYRMFGPAQPFAQSIRHDGDWTTIAIDEERLSSHALAKETELARQLTSFAPDLLIVDMFWAPLRHILPLANCEHWLLLRSFPPLWLVGPPGLPFEDTHYERIVSIEPGISSRMITHSIDPVVIVNPNEQQPPNALRRRLAAPPNKKLIAVMHAGNPNEHHGLIPATFDADNEMLVSMDLFEKEALFPAAEWLGQCDHVYAAAGYNAVWEAHWLGYAERTTFTPLKRRNDNTEWRLATFGEHVMKANGADTLAAWCVVR